MKTSSWLLPIALVVALAPAAPAEAPEWRSAVPDYEWSFPRDHWAHRPYRTEWWYFTGQLTPEGETEPRFGYQFTFFRIGVAAEDPQLDSGWSSPGLIMGHAAISNLATGEHRFSELIYRESEHLGGFAAYPDHPVAWSRAPRGSKGTWQIDWSEEDGYSIEAHDDQKEFSLRLVTTPARPKTFQGPNGWSRKAPEEIHASQYYSFTRLATAGVLRWDQEETRVTGESWMDKEFSSSQLADNQVGWDWFSLRFDDGSDCMLYVLRRADGTFDWQNGTLVSPGGAVRYLSRDEWSLETLDTWESPHTGAVYPSAWRITLPGRSPIEIVPDASDSENVSELIPDLYYWEGAITIRSIEGERLGMGYVELTGYGEDNRLPL